MEDVAVPARWRVVVLDAWPALLAVVLVVPLFLHGGHPLARDLVFLPRQPVTDASVGLGDATARASRWTRWSGCSRTSSTGASWPG